MTRNHTALKQDTHFCPAISKQTMTKAGYTLPTYAYMRMDYHGFVYQDMNRQRDGQKYDNTLTCYSKTFDTLADELGVNEKTVKRHCNHLVDKGLLVKLPFGKTGNDRNNLVVLDCGLDDYLEILKDCKVRLEKSIEDSKYSKKSKKQLHIIETILEAANDATLRTEEEEDDSW